VRQIKFRGLLQSGVFIYGSYVTDGKDYHAILRENPDDSLEMLNTPVIPESVGQLTGIQDEDDVDIYESMEIDGAYNVKFKNGSYVLIDISSGDIVLLHTYIESRSGNVKITREHTEI
jgi:hypothetical protein